jgi:hypothetical protein
MEYPIDGTPNAQKVSRASMNVIYLSVTLELKWLIFENAQQEPSCRTQKC